MRKTRLEQRIERIKRELQDIGPMRPGSLSKQHTVCGKAGCRCGDPKQPKKHGPYFQLSYIHQGKSTTQFIRKPHVAKVREQLANYKRFRRLTEDWVALSIEHARIVLDQLKADAK